TRGKPRLPPARPDTVLVRSEVAAGPRASPRALCIVHRASGLHIRRASGLHGGCSGAGRIAPGRGPPRARAAGTGLGLAPRTHDANQGDFTMTLNGHIFTAALLVAASALTGCAYDTGEAVGESDEAVVGVGSNDLDPKAIDNQLLARGVTDFYNITSSSVAD